MGSCLLAVLNLVAPSDLFAQAGTIRGTVTAAETAQPLERADGLIVGTVRRDVTDADGTYAFTVPTP